MVVRAASENKSRQTQSAEHQQQQYQKIHTIVSRSIAQEVRKQEQQQSLNAATNSVPQTQHSQSNKTKLMPTGKTLSGSLKVKQLNFAELAKPWNEGEKVKTIATVTSKILQEKFSTNCLSHLEARDKILTHLATQFHDHSFNTPILVLGYAFEDLSSRIRMLHNYIYNEYMEASLGGHDLVHYDKAISSVLNLIIDKAGVEDRDKYLPDLFSEAPLITLKVIEILKKFILHDSRCCDLGFTILQSLLEKRKSCRSQLLDITLYLTHTPERSEVRTNSIKTLRHIYERYPSETIRNQIEKFATDSLQRLMDASPYPDQEIYTWTEENIKTFLLPYLCLLPHNHKLIHKLAVVYVGTIPDIKRVILRVLDAPVKGMGMNSPELLLLVETCPKGAETLVTRMIHVLTDKQPPSAELVSRVRELYQRRVPDVRFLIPVLTGLPKREVVDALPKLIKLNPTVVKEVFNRLLGAQGSFNRFRLSF